MFLRNVYVSSYENLVIGIRLQLAIDETFVIESIAEDKGVFDALLKEFSCNVRSVFKFFIIVINTASGVSHKIFSVVLIRISNRAGVTIRDDNDIVVTNRTIFL